MTKLTHYLELIAIAQAEIPLSQILSEGMQQLHLALYPAQGKIGISFPQYNKNLGLGQIIRLFGEELELELIRTELNPLEDYFIINPIQETPKYHRIARFQRIHHKGESALRRAEKRLKAQGKWHDGVLHKMQQKQQQQKRYPHVVLKSNSNKQKFLLAIKKSSCTEHQEGNFNHYGLSNTSTVPDF